MTQRIFDVDNADDMALLWSMLSDDVGKITKRTYNDMSDLIWYNNDVTCESPFAINFHAKTEITRPMPECTEADVGKICAFWEDGNTSVVYAELVDILPNTKNFCYKYQAGHESNRYEHCRRLTKQEIEELI